MPLDFVDSFSQWADPQRARLDDLFLFRWFRFELPTTLIKFTNHFENIVSSRSGSERYKYTINYQLERAPSVKFTVQFLIRELNNTWTLIISLKCIVSVAVLKIARRKIPSWSLKSYKSSGNVKVNSVWFEGFDQTYFKAMKRSVLLKILPVLALSFWAGRAENTSSEWSPLTSIYTSTDENYGDSFVSSFDSALAEQSRVVRDMFHFILLEMRILLKTFA